MRSISSIVAACAVAAAVAAAVAGCGRRVTDANLGQVKPDMNPKEVESILGQPVRVEQIEIPLQTQRRMLPAARYVYEQDGRAVVVHFVNDKMVQVEGTFEPESAKPGSAKP